MRVTRQDVAKLAGVSGTTVSFALSGKRYVSEKLVKKINAAVKELNYFPDMIAKTMQEKKTYSIAVLTNDLTNPIHMQIIKSIEEHAMENGYFVNVCGGSAHLERYINNIISRRIDGVFIIADSYSVTSENIEQLVSNNVSVVFGTASGELDPRLCAVGIDFNAGMKEIVSYLRSIGHREIAYLSAFDEQQPDVRLSAFRSYMMEFFGNAEPIVEKGGFPFKRDVHAGYELTEALLDRSEKFTALVCMNDMMALGAIDALQARGLRVPEDVSVVGIDDIPFASLGHISLTTLSHKAEYFGERVFKCLQDNIADKSVIGRTVIVPDLIVRKSTRAR